MATFDPISHVSNPKLFFEVISYSFGIIFGQQTQEHVKTIKNVVSSLQTAFFHSVNVRLSFLAENDTERI